MQSSIALSAFAVLILYFGFADASSTRVITANGFGKGHFGMTLNAAQTALGTRFDGTNGSPESKSCWIYSRADGADYNLRYMFEKNHLTRIEVLSSVQRGPSAPVTTDKGIGIGIGIGSTIEEIRRAYGAAAVLQPDNDGDLYEVDELGGHRGIVFVTDGHAVVSFRAGVHPAVDYYEGRL